MTDSLFSRAKLRLCAALSMLLVIFGTLASAHEVMPSIAQMERQGDELVFSVESTIEGFVAGVDLDGLEDTNAAANAEAYDDLRALEPDALAERFRDYFPEMAENITVRADGTDLPLELQSVEVPEVGDTDQPRQSLFTFTAELPEGAERVEVGWAPEYGDLVLRQNGVEEPYDAFLQSGAISDPIDLAGGNQPGGWETFFEYIPVGVDHIVPLGLDHILFVLGLFFLAPRLGPLLWQVSAFTLAHTITLALAALGYVSVPGSIVEPLIALSIVYVAVENVLRTGALSPWRPAVIFCFGLLHGLGFASVLAEFGLPQSAFIPALVGFNIGVEIGQLAVIAVAYLIVLGAVRSARRGSADRGAGAIYLALAVIAVPALAIPVSQLGPELIEGLIPLLVACAILLGFSAAAVTADGHETYTRIVAMPASILIALVGAWWVVERVFL
ncbi:HupE/UreJ family protein [Histidinibacterium aquaticum]|uniref:HupE/UreJ family protein n=1 Tax=Histidinibacterium aquaticum TaxID=2613962 RepID=A0A5J5GM77_9RHOB|nr:HupE/UreJ family protein [Histidinibacterium aquaticum]KAA9009147.1 HupE/UreJ family protein [Histidinibacterium aquaticum]